MKASVPHPAQLIANTTYQDRLIPYSLRKSVADAMTIVIYNVNTRRSRLPKAQTNKHYRECMFHREETTRCRQRGLMHIIMMYGLVHIGAYAKSG